MSLRYAAVAALGLVMSGCSGPSGEPQRASPVIYSAGQEITLRVPTMSCQKGCYPVVKETLEQQAGVASVELYPQAKSAAIDDPRVRVTLNGSFDAEKAIAALAADNFGGATIESADNAR
jgi:hypothetical protein